MARQVVPAGDAWRVSPAGFARKIEGLVWPPHLRLVSHVLVLVATGRIKKLTVSMPPGHSKSGSIMRTFPAWMLDVWPERKIIGASYGASLAVDHGKTVREMIEQNQRFLRVRLKSSSTAAEDWQTTAGGGMKTAGLAGSIVGRRANVGLMDDLHKGVDDAHSLASRAGVMNFYKGDMRTRLFPGATEVVVGTRYHELDVIGQLTAGGDNPDWATLNLSALAEGDEDIDAVLGHRTCELLRSRNVPLPAWSRQAGSALWPTNIDPSSGAIVPWFDETEMANVRRDIGEYLFASLYQQRPAPPQGEMFPPSMWDRSDVVPPKVPLVRYWDFAATAGGGDWTVGLLMCRDEDGYVYIVDVVRGQWSDTDVEKVLKRTAQSDAERYGRRVRIVIEQEGGSGGAAWSRRLIREVLAGFNVKPDSPSGQKDVRARPLGAQQQAGFVRLVRVQRSDGSFGPAPWFDDLVEEYRVFDHGAHDDQVDAGSGAFNQLVGRGSRRVRTSSAAGRSVPT